MPAQRPDKIFALIKRFIKKQLPDAVVERSLRMAESGTVVAVDGSLLTLPIRSLCVHGDTSGAVDLAGRVRAGLEGAGLTPTPFAA